MSPEASAVLAIDLGTGGLKVGIYDSGGALVRAEVAEVTTNFGPNGAASQEPEVWWRLIAGMSASLAASTGLGTQVGAVACTGQWASTVPVDASGNAVGECILWMDTRGAQYANARIGGRVAGYKASRALKFVRKSGGAPSRYGADPIGHILYLEAEEPEVAEAAVWYLEPVDFLTMRLTGSATATAASMTAAWLTDNRSPGALAYDPELIRLAGVPVEKLPLLAPAGSIVGTVQPGVARELGIAPDAKVITGLPDLHTASVGSGATRLGEAHLCLSTTSWISAPIAKKKTDVIHSIASVPGVAPGQYLIADNHETAGECLDWLRDLLIAPNDPLGPAGFRPSFAELDSLAEGAQPGSGGVIFAPWLTGERSPVDDREARAAFIGISLATTRAEIVRAVLEGVAYSNRWLLGPFKKFLPSGPTSVRILGGGAVSDLWCQIHADVLGIEVQRVSEPVFVNLRGAALLALMATGAMDTEAARAGVKVDAVFVPDPSRAGVYENGYRVFAKMYPRLKPLFGELAKFAKTSR